MTPKKIIKAYQGIQYLMSIALPFKEARALARLKRSLEENINVIVENEHKLLQAHNGTAIRPGEYKFKDNETAMRFYEDLQAFQNQDDDTISLPTVDLSDQADQLNISAEAIEALEGLVIFEREDAAGPAMSGKEEDNGGEVHT